MTNSHETPIAEEEFVEIYGHETFSKPGKTHRTLREAIQLEKDMCPVEPEDRMDEQTRVSFLARQIGADVLLPEHKYLASQSAEN